MMQLKRAYEPWSPDDGTRFLVERLWPRGVKKTELKVDAWLKDVAPRDGLRRWFAHDSKKWPEFRRRYFAELKGHSEVIDPIRNAVARGRVTLVSSARDQEHNDAAALKDYLETHAIARRA